MSDKSRIDQLIEEVVSLPSLPGTVTEVRKLLDDPECSMRRVGELVATDAAIGMKTLRLVNSAQYGARHRVSSVEQAVIMLGSKVLRNLVLSAAVFEQIRKGTDQFVRHSICCGIAMEMLCDASPAVTIEPDEAFVYGILHDVGSLVFQEHMPREYEQCIELARERHIPRWQAEREIIGADHAEMGGRLAQHWQLPDEICAAIHGHHDIYQCPDENHRHIAALLALADYICVVSGLPAMDGAIAVCQDEVPEQAQLTTPEMPRILDHFFFALPNANELVETAGV